MKNYQERPSWIATLLWPIVWPFIVSGNAIFRLRSGSPNAKRDLLILAVGVAMVFISRPLLIMPWLVAPTVYLLGCGVFVTAHPKPTSERVGLDILQSLLLGVGIAALSLL